MHNRLHNGRMIRHADASDPHRNHFMDLAPGPVRPAKAMASQVAPGADDDMMRWVGHPLHLPHPDDKEPTT